MNHRPSIQTPLHIARFTRLMVMPAIIGLHAIGAFWAAWSEAYRGNKRG